MNKRVKIVAAICGMLFATLAAVESTQALKNSRKSSRLTTESFSSKALIQSRSGCDSHKSVCMEDSVRTWYGNWYE